MALEAVRGGSLFLLVHAERSAEGAKSKLRARLPFDFAAARLRSGRTEEWGEGGTEGSRDGTEAVAEGQRQPEVIG
jgi:hypothetical protein